MWSNLLYISHKTKDCYIWPPLKSQFGKRFLTGSIVLHSLELLNVSGSIFMRNCTIPEIKKIISELSSSKASDIPIRVLKACSDIISPLLFKFYNIFMLKAIFPNMLKVAQVTPINKKGDSQLLENYRPVSMLPIFGKIFEKNYL